MKKFLIICIFSFTTLLAQKVEKNPSGFSMIKLITNPEANDGKWVSITGFLKFKEGTTGLIYFTRDDMKYNNTKNGLILHFDSIELNDKNLSYYNGHYVRVIGYFHNINDYYYSGVLKKISYIESLDDANIEQQYIEIEQRKEKN